MQGNLAFLCKFGDEHLIELIEKSGNKIAAEIRQSIISSLEPCEKPDDVTLVVMKRV